MLTADDLTRIAEVVRQELARALHPSVRVVVEPSAECFSAYVAAASRPANDPDQPDEPPPPKHAA